MRLCLLVLTHFVRGVEYLSDALAVAGFHVSTATYAIVEAVYPPRVPSSKTLPRVVLSMSHADEVTTLGEVSDAALGNPEKLGKPLRGNAVKGFGFHRSAPFDKR